MIGIVIPTIPGREESLQLALDSYTRNAPDAIWEVYPDSPSSGEGWRRGTEEFVRKYGAPDYLHLTNDDCELIGSLEPAVEACDLNLLPAPIVRNIDGTLQSAGGNMNAPDNLIREIGPDWTPVGFTTVPFMSWEQWEQIGMLDVHYSSDVWVSHRGRELGIETVLRHGYEIVHKLHPVGRGAGMTQHDRAKQDRRIMEGRLAG